MDWACFFTNQYFETEFLKFNATKIGEKMMISNTLPFFTPEPLFGELTYPFYRNVDKLTD